ncbi:MAG TPA: 5-deoxy-glucuronate isomerase [Polyangiaceae bacterium]|jgi:5-deoxy-glucuronate isomerase|nr:5-deoxy-glucuronate isomerase [Polyangiaceae bacterium]
MQHQSLDRDRLIFRNTASQPGRHVSVSPQNSSMRHLNYGRIRLDRETPRASFATGDREIGLICLGGACSVRIAGEPEYALACYDALYVPRDREVSVQTSTAVDLVECSAPVARSYPTQLVRYAEVERDPSLKFTAGGPSTTRELTILIGKNVEAGRLVAGFTRSAPGHWTSWPPHEHAALLEEMYVYFDMPKPAFGVQFVYTQDDTPEFVGVVHDGDAVLMPGGYHPNVSVPGHGINFVWLMAAHRELEDRVFGVVNVQPGFAQNGSGLEASRK